MESWWTPEPLCRSLAPPANSERKRDLNGWYCVLLSVRGDESSETLVHHIKVTNATEKQNSEARSGMTSRTKHPQMGTFPPLPYFYCSIYYSALVVISSTATMVKESLISFFDDFSAWASGRTPGMFAAQPDLISATLDAPPVRTRHNLVTPSRSRVSPQSFSDSRSNAGARCIASFTCMI